MDEAPGPERLQDGTMYLPDVGAVRFKGYLYDPDTNEELAVMSKSSHEGIAGVETLYYPADYARAVIQQFEESIGKGSASDAIDQSAHDSIEGLAGFKRHGNSRTVFKEDTQTLLKQQMWFDLFKTLANIAAFGRAKEVLVATKKLLSFMRLQGLTSYDEDNPYRTDFFMNYPIMWEGYEECSISIGRVLLRISHLLILRCLYPQLGDASMAATRYAQKVMLFLTPASAWLDLTDNEGGSDDVSVANFCIGQQTLYFVKKIGAALLHKREGAKAKLLNHLCSTKFMGHPGSLVDEAELSSSKLGRGIVIKDIRYKDNMRSMLSMYDPSDFPRDDTRDWIEEMADKMVKNQNVWNRSVMRKLTAYFWNDLMFTSRKKRRRDFDSQGNVATKVLSLVDKVAPIMSGSEDSESGEEDGMDVDKDKDDTGEGGLFGPQEMQRMLRDRRFLSKTLASDAYKYRRDARSSETLYSGDKLGLYHSEVINQLKNTKLTSIRREDSIGRPYPQAGLDMVYEKFIIGRSLGHVSISSDTWRNKNCGICRRKEAPVDDGNSGIDPVCRAYSLVCSDCTRPYHQCCLASAFGRKIAGKERLCILPGDVRYNYTCSDCAILARHIGRLPSDELTRPDMDNLYSKQKTLMDVAIIAINVLTLQYQGKYHWFDIRQMWDTIKKYWKQLQPVVLFFTDTEKSSMFLGLDDERSVAKLSKHEAKTKLLTLLRSHPAFEVKEDRRMDENGYVREGDAMDTVEDVEGSFAKVGFSERFRPSAHHLLPLPANL